MLETFPESLITQLAVESINTLSILAPPGTHK